MKPISLQLIMKKFRPYLSWPSPSSLGKSFMIYNYLSFIVLHTTFTAHIVVYVVLWLLSLVSVAIFIMKNLFNNHIGDIFC